MQQHMLDEKRQEIKQDVLTMLDKTVEQYERIRDFINTGNKDLYKVIIQKDEEIDDLETLINDKTIEYIIVNSPIAGDLRNVISMFKSVSDVERIADYCINIAKTIRRGTTFSKKNIDKVNYGIDIVSELLTELHEIFDESSAEKAYNLAKKDDLIDELYNESYISFKMNSGGDFEELYSTLTILKHIERAGDHIVNITEDIVYADKGKHVDL